MWLSRARDAPLDVVLREDGKSRYPEKLSTIAPFITQVSKYLPRIADLIIDLCGVEELSQIHSTIIQPRQRFGCLRSLTIRSRIHCSYFGDIGRTPIDLVTSLLPELRVLVFHRCSLDWTWPVGNLRVLKLFHNPGSTGPFLHHLVDMLVSSL